ncbi:MAG: hypothetical protein KC444_05630 [Nitrosopumilus sp.]|nr:hypothetical protein [Nitrosopumilus sp.]
MSAKEYTRIPDDTDVKTWITTDAVTDPFLQKGFRVTWIDWDSSFRDSDLQIEDVIVGYDDVSFESFLEPGKHGSAIGQYGETTYWQNLGVKNGHAITLKVFRQGAKEHLLIPGKLLARRFYYDSEEKRALGPGGPPSMSSDGFSGSWSGWYEKLVWKMSYILDGGWDHRRINNKKEMEEHDSHKERIDYIMEHYPGKFADLVLSDWQKVHENLSGKEVGYVDLEYREIGAKRIETVRQEADNAWAKMQDELDIVPAFPAADVDDRDSVKDKTVELPWISQRNIINDLGQTFAVIGGITEGYYFVRLSDSVLVRRFYDAMYQYKSQVNPQLKERYQYVGRITGEPGLVTYDGRAVTGLMVDLVAARVGDGEFFVDLRSEDAGFAGHEKVREFVPVKISDDATPQQVIEAMILAVKLAHQEAWQRLFATWQAERYWVGRVVFNPSYVPRGLFSTAWEQSRRLVSDRVYDVRVDKTGPMRRIIQKNRDMGWPSVDEVDVFVDHYELLDGKYRSFLDINVRRKWTLQRLDEGPWRITTVQAI